MADHKWMGPGNELYIGDGTQKYVPGDLVPLEQDQLDFLLRLGHTFEDIGQAPGQPLMSVPGSMSIAPPGVPGPGGVTSEPEDNTPKETKTD